MDLVAEPLRAPSITLEPLTVEHAEAMSVVLADPALYAVIGGEPPTEEQLRARYARQVRGRSPDGREGWLNWIIVDAVSDQLAGYVQATIRAGDDHDEAELAWVIGTHWQGRRFATEAAQAVADWLSSRASPSSSPTSAPDTGPRSGWRNRSACTRRRPSRTARSGGSARQSIPEHVGVDKQGGRPP